MIDFEYGRNITDGGTGPDMTPMIDMIFQLLIFFLLTSFFILPAVNVALPKSRSADARPASSLVLTIEPDGSVDLGGERLATRDLPGRLGEALDRIPDRTVVIQSDQRVPFGRVVEVMEAARDARAQDISFMVERPEDGAR
jgi:biopolymer transport protein ExbD